MKKILVGRKVEYLETYEVDMDEFATARDDLDFCKRILCAADPVLSQIVKKGNSKAIVM